MLRVRCQRCGRSYPHRPSLGGAALGQVPAPRL